MFPLPFHNAFNELVVLLVVAAIAGVLSLRLRQPLIIGFIAVGILVGPSGLNWVRSTDQIHVFAEMGLALLLFVVGMKLDLTLIRKLGKVALATGIGQVLFTTVVGFLLALALGMKPMVAMYIAVALTFSSTIIVVKLLSDKREADSLHGRIALGILIVQDIVVVLAMIALANFTGEGIAHPGMLALKVVAKGLLYFAAVWVISYFIFPRLLPAIARSTELLVLFAITWALALAMFGDMLGFSKEVGAFVAGISLASTPYRDLIGVKLVSLRDFLLLFFFLEMGSRLDMGSLGAQVVTSIILALFVLIIKPIIIMLIMGALGYRKRTNFMTGMSLAQISEFSLILIALGAKVGHVGDDTVGVVTLVALITIALSTFLIFNAQSLYERVSRYIHIFERKHTRESDENQQQLEHAGADTVILIGLGNYGSQIGEQLVRRGRTVLGVDFDPSAVERWKMRGGQAIFGDAEDPDFSHAMALSSAQWVISSVRQSQADAAIINALRHAGYRGLIGLAADNRNEVPEPLAAQADLLFVPFENAAEQAVDLVVNLEEELSRRAMEKYIETLTEHYIVCGYGRMGQQIVKDFLQHNVPFVVVEDNPAQLPRLQSERVAHVIGAASQDEVLLQAGIARAQGLIAVASTDEENVFIVLSARGLNPALTIVARSIREENEDKLKRAGASYVLSPYILGGHRMAAAVTHPGVMDFLDLVIHNETFDTEIRRIPIPRGAPSATRTLEELGLWQSCGVTILAVDRADDGLVANPCPAFRLQEGDALILMGTRDQLAAAQQALAYTDVVKQL
jgi:Kef-type K+ transport system membrane component KefB/Trk K+ transport system NAD-binding subunit